MTNRLRREFLIGAASAGVSFASGSAFGQTWSEKYRNLGAAETARVDVMGMKPGQQVTLKLGYGPIVVRYRTEEEIEDARRARLEDLIDRFARNANLPNDTPATDENRTIDEDGRRFVYKPVCTHRGAITFVSSTSIGDNSHWIHCPTHGGRYDSAGRVRAGPPPRNLTIPPARFISAHIIEIHSHDNFSHERSVREAHPSEW